MKLAEEARLLRLKSFVGDKDVERITAQIKDVAEGGDTCVMVDSKGRGDTWATRVCTWLRAEGLDVQPVPGSHIAVYWE
jgi:hypothetical protein